MKTRVCIIFLFCLFQMVIYGQNSAQVTLTIRLHPIQTMEVVPSDAQVMEVSNEATPNAQTCNNLSVFSTCGHTTRVDSVKTKGFEALRAVREQSQQENKSINRIFSDQSNYYKGDEEHDDSLNVVYCMETR